MKTKFKSLYETHPYVDDSLISHHFSFAKDMGAVTNLTSSDLIKDPRVSYILKSIIHKKRLADKIGNAFGDIEHATRLLAEIDYLIKESNPKLLNTFVAASLIHDISIEEDVFLGWGKGTAPSSILLFGLGLTNTDPVKHGLLFERFFLQEKRDISIEVSDRDLMICALKFKFGRNLVNHIEKDSVISINSAIRRSCAEAGINRNSVDRVINMAKFGYGQGEHTVANFEKVVEADEKLIFFFKELNIGLYDLVKSKIGKIIGQSRHPIGMVVSTECEPKKFGQYGVRIEDVSDEDLYVEIIQSKYLSEIHKLESTKQSYGMSQVAITNDSILTSKVQNCAVDDMLSRAIAGFRSSNIAFSVASVEDVADLIIAHHTSNYSVYLNRSQGFLYQEEIIGAIDDELRDIKNSYSIFKEATKTALDKARFYLEVSCVAGLSRELSDKIHEYSKRVYLKSHAISLAHMFLAQRRVLKSPHYPSI